MTCNNILAFENLIEVPKDIDYEIKPGAAYYYVAVNTDDLEILPEPVKYSSGNIVSICPGKNIPGEAELDEIRVSGYLNYSISVKCLKSSDNFIINTTQTESQGCISVNSILPITSEDIYNKLPYIVVGYLPPNTGNIKIQVELTEIKIASKEEINGNYFIVVQGKFKIEMI